MFNDCRPREAIERYAGAHDIQHNPQVVSGKAAFIDCFERMAAEHPGHRVEIHQRLRRGRRMHETSARRDAGQQQPGQQGRRAGVDDDADILTVRRGWMVGSEDAGVVVEHVSQDRARATRTAAETLRAHVGVSPTTGLSRSRFAVS